MKNKLWLTLALSTVMLGTAVIPAGAAYAATDKSPDGNYSMNLDSTVESDIYGEDTSELSAAELALLEEATQFFDYADQMDLLMDYEEKAWDAYSINEYVTASNRKQEYKLMNYTVVPNYTKFVSGLKLIKPENKELAKIHQKYVKGAYMELEGFILYNKMVSKTKLDFTLLAKAKAKISAGGKLIDQFNDEMDAYLARFDVLDLGDDESAEYDETWDESNI